MRSRILRLPETERSGWAKHASREFSSRVLERERWEK